MLALLAFVLLSINVFGLQLSDLNQQQCNTLSGEWIVPINVDEREGDLSTAFCRCKMGFDWNETACVETPKYVLCQSSGGEWVNNDCMCPENSIEWTEFVGCDYIQIPHEELKEEKVSLPYKSDTERSKDKKLIFVYFVLLLILILILFFLVKKYKSRVKQKKKETHTANKLLLFLTIFILFAAIGMAKTEKEEYEYVPEFMTERNLLNDLSSEKGISIASVQAEEPIPVIIVLKNQPLHETSKKVKKKHELEVEKYENQINNILEKTKQKNDFYKNSNLATQKVKSAVESNQETSKKDKIKISDPQKSTEEETQQLILKQAEERELKEKEMKKKGLNILRQEELSLLSEEYKNKTRELSKNLDSKVDEIKKEIYDEVSLEVENDQNEIIEIVNNCDGIVTGKSALISSVFARILSSCLYDLKESNKILAVYEDQLNKIDLDVSVPSTLTSTWYTAGYTGGIWDAAVVDTGIDGTHPALTVDYAAVFHNTSKFYSNYNDDFTSTDDLNGHGTHVAGIITSTDSTYKGVAYGMDALINAKTCYNTDDGQGSCPSSDNMLAIDWAVNTAGADVVSRSIGMCDSSVSDCEMARFLDAVVDDLGISVVNSAGNSGPSSGTVGGIAYNAFSVANVNDGGTTDRSNDVIANGSSRGPTFEGRVKPDIAAPGTNIKSANNDWEGLGSNFVDLSGTSMAAPHIAGAILLVLDYKGIRWDPKAIRALFFNTADNYGSFSTTNDFGWGYIDLNHAYIHRDDVNLSSISEGSYKFYKGTFFAGDKTTLVWNRHVTYNDANFPTNYYSLNDLDLYFYDESDNSLKDHSLTSADNVEQVEATGTVTGVLKVDAFTTDFSHGSDTEDFALATEEGFSAKNGPNLTISQKVPSTASTLVNFTITTTVTNNGDLKAHDVGMTLNLPSGLTILSGQTTQSFNISAGNSGTASWVVNATGGLGIYNNINTSFSSISYGEIFSGISPLNSTNVILRTGLVGNGYSLHNCSTFNSVLSIDYANITNAIVLAGSNVNANIKWAGWHFSDENHWAFFLDNSTTPIGTCKSFNDDVTYNAYDMNCSITIPPSTTKGLHLLRITSNDFQGYCYPGEFGTDAEIAINIDVDGPGNLVLQSTHPTFNFNVSKFKLFNFTISIKCVDGDCTDINLILDPQKTKEGTTVFEKNKHLANYKKIMSGDIRVPNANDHRQAFVQKKDQLTKNVLSANEAFRGIDVKDLILKKNVETKLPGKNKKFDVLIYEQTFEGLPVHESFLVSIFKNDIPISIKSNYYPNINFSIKQNLKISEADAFSIATTKLNLSGQHALESSKLIIYPGKSTQTYYLAWRLEFPLIKSPLSKYTVFVDANSGQILDYFDNIIHSSIFGTVTGEIFEEHPSQLQSEIPFNSNNVSVGNKFSISDGSGFYNISGLGGPITLSAKLEGPYAKVLNEGQPAAMHTFDTSLPMEHNFNWKNYDSSYKQEESNVFYHTNKIHDFFAYNLDLTEMDFQMLATVNLNYTCNAYYFNKTINFYKASETCENTALLSDVIYHEYTHGVVEKVITIDFPYWAETGNMNEGFADYFAATVNNNPCMAENFSVNGPCLRELNNTKRYPEDYHEEPHGLIFQGALWDLRESLGKNLTDHLVIAAMKLQPVSFADYLENLLLVDDDNDNLIDKTPHWMQICEAFYVNHGIYSDYCVKGIVPMNSGIPFFTYDQNPYNCGNLTNNQECTHTWRINSTGQNGTSWEFFIIYMDNYQTYLTNSVNITIYEDTIQDAYSPLNITIVEQYSADHNIVLDCNVTDFNATKFIWDFGDGTSVTKNLSVFRDDFTWTKYYHTYLQSGVYNVNCNATNGTNFAFGSKNITVSTGATPQQINNSYLVSNFTYLFIGNNTIEYYCNVIGLYGESAKLNIEGNGFSSSQHYPDSIPQQEKFPTPGNYSGLCRSGVNEELYAPEPYNLGGGIGCSSSSGNCVDKEDSFLINIPDVGNLELVAGIRTKTLSINTLNFTCQAYGFDAVIPFWNFGDGNESYSVDKTVSHRYSLNGNYSVSCYYQDSDSFFTLPKINISISIPISQNITTCYSKVNNLSANCTGGIITSDTFSGGCRFVTCSKTGSSMQIKACDKPTLAAPTFFEIYKQSSAGSLITQICVGVTCIKSNTGYIKSTSYPMCFNQTIQNNQTNSTPLIQNGSLRIFTNPNFADVYLNNTFKGITNSSGELLILNLGSGNYGLLINKSDYSDNLTSITITQGQNFIVNVNLKSNPITNNTNSTIIKNSTLSITTIPPSVDVYLNNSLRGTSNNLGSFIINNIQPGSYSLGGKKIGYFDYTNLISLNAGQNLSVIITLNQIPQQNVTQICYKNITALTASCKGGTITQDTTSGCRTIICSNSSNSLKVLACNKPGNINPTYFEMYKQGVTGTPPEICLGNTCIKTSGYAKSLNFPICFNITTSVNITSNVSAASVTLVEPYSADHNSILDCNVQNFTPTQFIWDFGDGTSVTRNMALDGFLSTKHYHTYLQSGTYNVKCNATNGTNNAYGSTDIKISTGATPQQINNSYLVSNLTYQFIGNNAIRLYCNLIGIKEEKARFSASGNGFSLNEWYHVDIPQDIPFPTPGNFSGTCDSGINDELYSPEYYNLGHSLGCSNQFSSCVHTEDYISIFIPNSGNPDLIAGLRTNILSNDTIQFTCQAYGFDSGASIWDFGDGNSSYINFAGKTVIHKYNSNGNYSVNCHYDSSPVLSGTSFYQSTTIISIPTVNSIPIQNGTLTVTTIPSLANIFLNNTLKGTSNSSGQLVILNIIPGNYNLRVEKINYHANITPMVINPGQNLSLSITLNQISNSSTCFSSVKTIPANCTGTITQNTTSGNCRTMVCSTGANNIKVMSCDKPDSEPKQFFEMYRQSISGAPPKLCIGNTCIQNEGFKKSLNFPICI